MTGQIVVNFCSLGLRGLGNHEKRMGNLFIVVLRWQGYFMRFLKRFLLSIILIWAVVYVVSEVKFYREAKTTLTDKTHCSSYSTREKETHPEQIHYFVEWCDLGRIEGMGTNLRTMIRVYEENKPEVLYEEMINQGSASTDMVDWSCDKGKLNSCELLISSDTGWFGSREDLAIKMTPARANVK